MRLTRFLICAATGLAAATATPVLAQEASPAPPSQGPVIETTDVDRFYALYDAAGGRPSAEQLQAYLDEGSEGLRNLARARNVTGVRIADAIGSRPEMYAEARACARMLPRVRARVTTALERFVDLYPQARFPPATFAIGRGKPIAIGSPVTGIQVGLEALCASDFINPDTEDRFVRVLVHEYVHSQQAAELTEKEGLTVLEVSLVEGIAEFVTELVSGDGAYAYLDALVAGREAEIEAAFLPDVDKTDLSAWVYNSTPETPGDLGYWVGYRIAKAYYAQAADKREALRRMLRMTDATAFLAESGWRPGMALD